MYQPTVGVDIMTFTTLYFCFFRAHVCTVSSQIVDLLTLQCL